MAGVSLLKKSRVLRPGNRKLSRAVVLSSVVAELLERRQLLSGTLDTSWGTGGTASSGFPGSTLEGVSQASLLQSDGKLVIGGNVITTANPATSAFGLTRFNADGTLDTSFGNSGQVVTNFTAGYDTLFAVAQQTNGDIVAVGEDGLAPGFMVSTSGHVAVARYLPDGSLDPSFGTAGKVVLSSIILTNDTFDLADAVNVQANGQLVIAGVSSTSSGNALFVVRLNADGTQDTTFGNGNSAYTLTGWAGSSVAMTVDPSGDILLGSGSFNTADLTAPKLIRLLPTGQRDTTFGLNGFAVLPSYASDGEDYYPGGINSLVVEPNDDIVFAGMDVHNDPEVGLLDANGIQIASFLGMQTFTDSAEFADTGVFQISVLSNGDLLAAIGTGGGISSAATTPIILSALLPTGAIDTSFATNGSVVTQVYPEPKDSEGFDAGMVVRNDGSIIVTGNPSATTPGFFAAQYTGISTSAPLGMVTGTILVGGVPVTGVVVYLDANGDSTLDNGELSTTTNINGSYAFSNVPAGSYVVRQIDPAGYTQTTPSANTGFVLPADGFNVANANFVDAPILGTISGSVTLGGSALAGATVYLDANNDSTLGAGELSEITDSSGNYSFTNVPIGTYTIRQIPPAPDVQISPAANAGYPVTISPGTVLTNQNFADSSQQFGSISGTVSAGNTPLSGASITLGIPGGGLYGNTVLTGSDGTYSIQNVPVGTYLISQGCPANYAQTSPASNGDLTVVVSSGVNLTNENFTDILAGSVSGVVTGGPLTGNKINFQPTGSSVPYATTLNSAGDYTISVLPASYLVTQTLPAGYIQVSPANNAGISVTVTSGGSIANINFKDAPGGSVTGAVTTDSSLVAGETVYLDANNNSVLDNGELSTITNSSGAYSFPDVSTGSYTIRQVLATGYSQITPAANAGIQINVVSGSNFINETFTDALPGTIALTGTTIGTAGSYQNDGNTIAKATDGNLSTFFDGPSANGNWVGIDTGVAGAIVTSVEYASRSGFASRMNNGIFQASNSATFNFNVATLGGITSNANPPSSTLTTQVFDNFLAYRYYRYLSPIGSYGDISELQFFGTPGVVVIPIPVRLTGTTIGTVGSYQNDGNTIAKATDGNLSTFFDGPTANGNWVGIDLGAAGGVLTEVMYAARNGYLSRMNGAIFQGSNSATFATGTVNLFTIPANANPGSSALTMAVFPNTTAYRYYRYLSPTGSYGDISEVEFFGTVGGLAAPTQLTGTTIGTAGSYQNDGNTIAKATDGNLSTFFDGASANSNWVGLDLGSVQVIGQISYAPRSGFASRMVGGEFQVSTTADFSSGVTTICTITASPTTGSLTTITLASPVAARYVRYLSPSGSYGDVSEIAFDS